MEQQHWETVPPRTGRPRYRPPVGIPDAMPPENRVRGVLLSLVLHALIVMLLIVPALVSTGVIEVTPGGGGPGPAGGGGGGNRGTGGAYRERERLQYIQVSPTPVATPSTLPPIVPPVEEKKDTQPVVPPTVEVNTEMPKTAIAIDLTSGTGGGSGTDGSAGSGPGSGGGTGSGIGTGRGSGTGPGTGGGPGTIYPPTPAVLLVAPFPIPEKIRGTQVIAVFDVDERGNVISFDFTRTKDGSYNKRLRDMLGEIRFRPATTFDGTPVRAKTSVSWTI